MYLEFLDDNSWTENNNTRKVIVNYVKLCSSFRTYFKAIREGDRIIQEKLFVEWLPIFNLMNKKNYFLIVLNTIEKYYGDIDFATIEEYRRNSFVRYNSGKDKDGRSYHCVALDEAQEMVNSWTKKMPLGTDPDRWVVHSKNLMFTRQCMNYEQQEYKRRYVQYTDKSTNDIENVNGNKLSPTKTVVPTVVREKTRLYEWVLFLCDENNSKEIPFTNGLMKCAIDSIQTQLMKNNETNGSESIEKDELRDCVTNLLDNIATLDDNTDKNDDEEMDGDTTEDLSINDHILIDNNDTIDEINPPLNNALDVCHKFALVDIFAHGNTVLKEKNIISIRKKRKKRLKRYIDFFDEVNNTVIEQSLKLSNDLVINDNSYESHPMGNDLWDRYNKL